VFENEAEIAREFIEKWGRVEELKLESANFQKEKK